MNDQDYIRKAVEMADGWELSNDKEPLIYLDDGTPNGILSFMSWSYPQFMLDAIAAQLVRQVDAATKGHGHYKVNVWPNYTQISLWDATGGETILERQSPDRTMNSIKAVVDSGVLEQSDE